MQFSLPFWKGCECATNVDVIRHSVSKFKYYVGVVCVDLEMWRLWKTILEDDSDVIVVNEWYELMFNFSTLFMLPLWALTCIFFSQALVLPQAIATPTGGIILDMFEKLRCDIGLGYIILFLVTSVYFVLSGIFVYNIKKAK